MSPQQQQQQQVALNRRELGGRRGGAVEKCGTGVDRDPRTPKLICKTSRTEFIKQNCEYLQTVRGKNENINLKNQNKRSVFC